MNVRIEDESKKKLDAFLAWAQEGLKMLPDDTPEEALDAFTKFVQQVSFYVLRLSYQDFMTGEWVSFKGRFSPAEGDER